MKKEFFNYLRPLFSFFGIGLLIFSLSRILLFFLFRERVMEAENYGYIFSLGLWLDVVTMSYLSIIPFLLITFATDKTKKFTNKFLTIYCAIFLFIIVFMELVTPQFIDQYDTRPNRLFVDYLIYPKEVASMLLKARPMDITIISVLLAACIWGLVKLSPKLFRTSDSPIKYRLILLPLIAFLLIWGARGSLTSKRPVNSSNVVFSNSQIANCLGVNSLYSLMYALYSFRHEVDTEKMYGKMDEQEAYSRVKKYMDVPLSDFNDPEIPFLHTQQPDSVREKPYNLVIFLQESLGAEYVGCLGGMPLTPNLDALAKEGLLFTNLYCTGTRSVRGIEAVVTGFLPTPSQSVVKLNNSQNGFFSLAELLKNKGYNTSFVYGGMGNFDNMASFFNGNGFDNIVDQTSFDSDGTNYALKGTWGYSDEDLAVKANNYFKNLNGKSFFSLMFSTSNHEPFEFPDGRIELYEKPKQSVHNAMKYADFAIGKFFELAKKEEYYKNTIFVVIADHNTRTYGKNLIPINKFHIPAVIVGPNIKPNTRYDKLCSQIDIPPTLIYNLGMPLETPMVGRNLMTLPDNIAGRAIMQFHDINAFRVDNKVIVLQPGKEALQFEVKNDTTLIPMLKDAELGKDALANVLAPTYMYKNKKYRLKSSK